MTSVRNRLLPLSGNKAALLWLFLFTLGACKTQQGVTEVDPDEPIEVVDNNLSHKDSVRLGLIDTTAVLPNFIVKDTYQVSVILPFFAKDLPLEADSLSKSLASRKSLMAFDLYRGMQVALDSLKKQGFKVKVNVYDSYKNTDTVRSILKKPEFAYTDLIIGPIYNNNLRIVAQYAKRTSVPMISPLSPKRNIAKNNINYIMFNPTLDVHCERIFAAVKPRFENNHVVLFYQPNEVEQGYANNFTSWLEAYKDSTFQNISSEDKYKPGDSSVYNALFKKYTINDVSLDENMTKPGQDESPLKDYLVEDQSNLVIIPSVDKKFILNLSRELNLLHLEGYEITVMGMPIWGDYDKIDLRMDYLNNLNVHFTSSYFLPEFMIRKSPVGEAYFNRYHRELSEYSVKGYDLMYYFGMMLNQYGLDFRSKILEHHYAGLHTSFRLRPKYDATAEWSDETILFLENQYVHLLQYYDFMLIKAK